VALFLVTSSSLVVFDASSTSLLILAISLHSLFSETGLAEWVPLCDLAATDAARRKETMRDWNCMMKSM